MNNRVLVLAAIACLGGGATIARAEQKTITGKISDSLCGASHAAMAAKQGSKVTDRDCVVACLNYSTEDSPKLVFVEQGGKIYTIANQKFAGLVRHVGETVAATGDVDGTTLTIAKLEVVSSGK
jgi:hypothetical protein